MYFDPFKHIKGLKESRDNEIKEVTKKLIEVNYELANLKLLKYKLNKEPRRVLLKKKYELEKRLFELKNE